MAVTGRMSPGGWLMALFRVVRFNAAACLAAGVLVTAAACKDFIASDDYEVQIGGETFLLEVAADGHSRYQGLSGREFIAPNGGMIFVYPYAAVRYFVMRDCLVAIDIMFIDGAGSIINTYTMSPDKPRADDESKSAYERRLTRYYSEAPSQYVIELRAGTIDRLGLERGGLVPLDTRWLQNTLR